MTNNIITNVERGVDIMSDICHNNFLEFFKRILAPEIKRLYGKNL